MSTEDTECELQQLVSSDEENNNVNNESITPPETSIVKTTESAPKMAYVPKMSSSKVSSADTSGIEESSFSSRISRNVTNVTSSSNTSTHAFNVSSGTHIGATRVLDNRPAQPNLSKLHSKKDAMDVRQMEQALLQLLDDFHSGKLRAFGKNCSMEQMTAIHQQQEHLARLHFELAAQQELFVALSEDALKHGVKNMHSLMDSLKQLSLSIEKLHVINSKTDGGVSLQGPRMHVSDVSGILRNETFDLTQDYGCGIVQDIQRNNPGGVMPISLIPQVIISNSYKSGNPSNAACGDSVLITMDGLQFSVDAIIIGFDTQDTNILRGNQVIFTLLRQSENSTSLEVKFSIATLGVTGLLPNL